jgi:DNA-binding MarR family transcriptional regulator
MYFHNGNIPWQRTMTAGGEQQPSTDQVAQFLRYLAEILPNITPMPPEMMAHLGGHLNPIHPKLSSHLVAEPPVFYRMAGMLCRDTKPTMGELSGALSLPLSTVSRMVSLLEEHGYAQRLPDPADGRVVRVALTNVGRQLHEAIESHAARSAQSILGCLTPEEQIILLTLLAKVASNLNRDTR